MLGRFIIRSQQLAFEGGFPILTFSNTHVVEQREPEGWVFFSAVSSQPLHNLLAALISPRPTNPVGGEGIVGREQPYRCVHSSLSPLMRSDLYVGTREGPEKRGIRLIEKDRAGAHAPDRRHKIHRQKGQKEHSKKQTRSQ